MARGSGWRRSVVGLAFGLVACRGTGIDSGQSAINDKDGSCGLSGAVFTTYDPSMGGCNNGMGIDCNIYDTKADVYLTGGPGPSSLEDGTYFWAVLVPGSQNGGWMDGAM